MGRPPQPNALKILKGNPGRRPMQPQPQPGPLSPDIPPELTDPTARSEWQRVMPGLIAIGMVTMSDRAIAIGYCVYWAQWVRLEALGGMHREQADQAFRMLLRAAGELGLSPTRRTRVSVSPPAKRSPWADVLP